MQTYLFQSCLLYTSRFPYVAGENGGGLFVLLYLIFLVLMGIPVLTMELAVGRACLLYTSEHQQEMVKALSERASLVHSGTVDPSQDNMLKITSDGRKLGLDQRIVNQMPVSYTHLYHGTGHRTGSHGCRGKASGYAVFPLG